MSTNKIVFTDFDGTITDNERLPQEFQNIISMCHNNKSSIVIVTGRPEAWGWFLMTHFDIDACIVEDGAAILTRVNENIERKILISENATNSLKTLKQFQMKKYPKIQSSNDSQFRNFSLAFSNLSIEEEEGTFLDETLKLKLPLLKYQTKKFTYFTSKETNKMIAISKYASSKKTKLNNCLFFGDSINDQVVFQNNHITSIGVSNINPNLTHSPNHTLKGPDNRSALGVHNYLTNYFQMS